MVNKEYQKWFMLKALLARNNSINYCFNLLANSYPNDSRLQQILHQLQSGMDIKDILLESKVEKQIGFYAKYTSFEKSIEIVEKHKKQQDELVDRFIKECGYPICIFIVSSILLYYFTVLVIPQMLSVLTITDATAVNFQRTFVVMSSVIRFILIMELLMIAIATYFYFSGKINYLWMLLYKLKIDKPIRMLATYQFVSQLNILLQNSISLSMAIEILRFENVKSFSSLLAYHFDENALNGMSLIQNLDDRLFDEQLKVIISIAIEQKEFTEVLADYCQMVEIKIQKMISTASFVIKVLSYGFAALIIILSYRVMLLPLNLLEEI